MIRIIKKKIFWNIYKIQDENENEIDLKKIFKIDKIVKSAYTQLRFYNEYNNNFEQNILNLNLSEQTAIDKLEVNYVRINFQGWKLKNFLWK